MTQKGMRLVAMIEQKENGQYDVVNFLPDLKIKHITGKEFEVIEDKDYIKIPYAQGIDDLTVIVGENGVGKTRLVNDIFSLDEKKLFVFEKVGQKDVGGRRKLIYYDRSAISESSQGKNTRGMNFEGVIFSEWDYSEAFFKNYIDPSKSDLSIVKVSHSIELSLTGSESADLSTTRKLNLFSVKNLLLEDMDWQIKFLLSNCYDAEKLEQMLSFSGKHLDLYFEDNFVGDALRNEQTIGINQEYLAELERLLLSSESLSFGEKIDFYLTCYFSYIYSFYFSRDYYRIGFSSLVRDENIDYLGLVENLDKLVLEKKREIKNFLMNKFREAELLGESANEYVRKELEKRENYAVQNAGYIYQFYSYDSKRRIESIKNIVDNNSKKNIDYIDKLFNYSGEIDGAVLDLRKDLSNKPLSIIFHNDNQKFKYLILGIEKISKILSLQRDMNVNPSLFVVKCKFYDWERFSFLRHIIQAISFEWQGLSSGQLALLNLFGRLHSLVEEVKDKESILLLLDEVDLGLHPEWQRKWVSTALPIIGEIFKGKYVQIILTTHSPIMLSDIYGENVLMLRKDTETGERQVVYGGEVPSTSFGQNIHQLFKESFFLEQTKGDYSLKVINATIKAVYDLNQERADEATIKADFASELGVGDLSDGQFRAYLEKVIGTIGEKVIAQKLQDMYQTIPLWSQVPSLEGKRAGDLSTEELRQLLRQREEAGQ